MIKKQRKKFIDRPERDADKLIHNTKQRLSDTIVTVQQFPKKLLEKLEKFATKMPPKRLARHRGDDDCLDVRRKTLPNAIVLVCIFDNQTENGAAFGPEGPGQIW